MNYLAQGRGIAELCSVGSIRLTSGETATIIFVLPSSDARGRVSVLPKKEMTGEKRFLAVPRERHGPYMAQLTRNACIPAW